MAKKAMRAALQATGHSFLAISFAVEGQPAGRIVVELFESVCPATCANFKALALGGGGSAAAAPEAEAAPCARLPGLQSRTGSRAARAMDNVVLSVVLGANAALWNRNHR